MKTMDRCLMAIANILLLNTQYVLSNGFLNGKLGISTFFFHLAKSMQIPKYNEYADYLVDDVISTLDKRNLGFINGLSGIGYGINHLIKNEFIEGNPEEILEDIERIIFASVEEQLRKDLQTDVPLFSVGLYITSKETWEKDFENIEKVIAICEKNLSIITLSNKNNCMINSILYTLFYLYKRHRNKFGEKIEKLLILLLNKMIVLNGNLDLDLLINFNEETVFDLFAKYSFPINFIWENFLYSEKAYKKFCEDEIYMTMDKIINEDIKSNLSINGLAGNGLNLIRQKNFENRV